MGLLATHLLYVHVHPDYQVAEEIFPPELIKRHIKKEVRNVVKQRRHPYYRQEQINVKF